MATIVESRASCSAFVDQPIKEETPAVIDGNGSSNSSKPILARTLNTLDTQHVLNEMSDISDISSETDNDTVTLAAIDPWIVDGINVTRLFYQYRSKVRAMDELYVMETHLQEVLAAADILFLAPDDHSRHMIDVFGLSSLSAICDHILADLMPADAVDCKLKDDEFMEVIHIINALDDKTKSIREAKRDLLMLSSSMNGTKANVMEGIANLLTKLPRHEIYNQDKIGEVELQATYYDPFLSEIVADQEKNVALRWANKSLDDESDIRPDAIISTLVLHDLGHPVGFGEVKPDNSSTVKCAVNLDVFRLGIVSKRAIDKWGLRACLAFMINGFVISFFIITKRHDSFYTMIEIGSMTVASSLTTLHSFATMRNLNLLAAISNSFWVNCNMSPSSANINPDGPNVVPISEYLKQMSKSSKKSRGQSSRY